MSTYVKMVSEVLDWRWFVDFKIPADIYGWLKVDPNRPQGT